MREALITGGASGIGFGIAMAMVGDGYGRAGRRRRRGRWRFLEHDWVATEGSYVYEAPGETHTLVVDEDVPGMITLFQVNGAMIYVDPDGGMLGYEDVFSKIEACRAHYATAGLGEGYVDRFIR